MIKLQKEKRMGILIGLMLILQVFFLFPFKVYAAKQLTLSANSATVEAGQNIEVKIDINTEGEKVNVVGFNIDFSTETLEGLIPNQSGSVFPMCATLSATRYECGITGQNGFSGTGLLTTLVFKGRQAGQTDILLRNFEARYGPSGTLIADFSSNSISISVYGEGQKPPPPSDEGGGGGTSGGTTNSSQTATNQKIISAPTPLPDVDAGTPPPAAEPGETLGKEPQVAGPTGAQPEDLLKPAVGGSEEKPTVKGLFTKSPIYVTFLPTFLLLMLVIYLGIKLYFTEKRRHLEIEHLFETQLGTLGVLESKLDLVDQKGEGGKEKFLQEFEQIKSQIMAESSGKTPESKGKT